MAAADNSDGQADILGNNKEGHISRIMMHNWWKWTTDLSFEKESKKVDKGSMKDEKASKKDKKSKKDATESKNDCFCFIGENNTGKSLMLETLSIASHILRHDVARHANQKRKKFKITLDAAKEHSIIAVECKYSKPFYFGLCSCARTAKWTWDAGNENCFCFAILGTDVYAFRWTSKEHNQILIKRCDVSVGRTEVGATKETVFNTDRLLKMAINANGKGELKDNLPEDVEALFTSMIPQCYVLKWQIAEIYAGDQAVHHEFTDEGTHVKNEQEETFEYHEQPAGYKFKSFITDKMTEMLDNECPKCLIVDEPTRCMHPVLIREFMYELTTNDQVQIIMSTHSPLACRYLPPDNMFVFKRDPCHAIKNVGENIEEIDMKLLYDCLFARHSIVVEGKGEYRLLLGLFNEMKKEPEKYNKHLRYLHDVEVVETKGKGLLQNSLRSCRNLDKHIKVITDGDSIFGGSAKDMPKKLKMEGKELFNELKKGKMLASIEEFKLEMIGWDKMKSEDVWMKFGPARRNMPDGFLLDGKELFSALKKLKKQLAEIKELEKIGLSKPKQEDMWILFGGAPKDMPEKLKMAGKEIFTTLKKLKMLANAEKFELGKIGVVKLEFEDLWTTLKEATKGKKKENLVEKVIKKLTHVGRVDVETFEWDELKHADVWAIFGRAGKDIPDKFNMDGKDLCTVLKKLKMFAHIEELDKIGQNKLKSKYILIIYGRAVTDMPEYFDKENEMKGKDLFTVLTNAKKLASIEESDLEKIGWDKMQSNDVWTIFGGADEDIPNQFNMDGNDLFTVLKKLKMLADIEELKGIVGGNLKPDNALAIFRGVARDTEGEDLLSVLKTLKVLVNTEESDLRKIGLDTMNSKDLWTKIGGAGKGMPKNFIMDGKDLCNLLKNLNKEFADIEELEKIGQSEMKPEDVLKDLLTTLQKCKMLASVEELELEKIGQDKLKPDDIWKRAESLQIFTLCKEGNCDLEASFDMKKKSHEWDWLMSQSDEEVLKRMPAKTRERIIDIIKE